MYEYTLHSERYFLSGFFNFRFTFSFPLVLAAERKAMHGIILFMGGEWIGWHKSTHTKRNRHR